MEDRARIATIYYNVLFIAEQMSPQCAAATASKPMTALHSPNASARAAQPDEVSALLVET